jgi:hypothetical protein
MLARQIRGDRGHFTLCHGKERRDPRVDPQEIGRDAPPRRIAAGRNPLRGPVFRAGGTAAAMPLASTARGCEGLAGDPFAPAKADDRVPTFADAAWEESGGSVFRGIRFGSDVVPLRQFGCANTSPDG